MTPFAIGIFAWLMLQPGAAPPLANAEDVSALHRRVFELPPDRVLANASDYQELALRYLRGRGVDQDPVQGCALIERSYLAVSSGTHDQQAIDMVEALRGCIAKGSLMRSARCSAT